MSRAVMTRPSGPDLTRLGIAVVFISLSGPMIAATVAAPLAIAFWRCFIGSGLTGIFVLFRDRSGVRSLTRWEWRMTVFAGVLLGLHFATWIPSLWLTSIASSTALVATQPIWAAIIARLLGITIPRQVWFGIGISIVGVVLLTGVDFSLDPTSLIGDALALLGAVFSAAYVTVVERVRQSVSTATVTFVAYGFSALTVLPILFLAGQSLVGFGLEAWLLILGVTLGAQLLGHTLMSKVLKTTSATVVSLAILLEMPGATLIAAVWLGQVPPLALYPAAALIFAGLFVVIRASAPRNELVESPPV